MVLVPQEPINVPAGTPLRISYEPIEETADSTSSSHAVKPAAGANIVDRLPLVRGLDEKLVRQVVDDPANELCNMEAEEFLLRVRGTSDQTKSD